MYIHSFCAFQVVRRGGSISSAVVTWEAQGDTGNDLMETSGNVTFQDKQTSAQILVRVRGDITPELDETFIIKLFNTTTVNTQTTLATLRAFVIDYCMTCIFCRHIFFDIFALPMIVPK